MTHDLREPSGLVTILKQRIELLKNEKGLKGHLTQGYIIALHDVIELWSNIDHSDEECVKIFLTDHIFCDWS